MDVLDRDVLKLFQHAGAANMSSRLESPSMLLAIDCFMVIDSLLSRTLTHPLSDGTQFVGWGLLMSIMNLRNATWQSA